MRNGFRTDVIVAALILSVAVHVCVMLWAKPKVMTHVVSDTARTPRRRPISVVQSRSEPEPVRFEAVKDLPAQKEAPEVDDSAMAVPSPDLVSPMPETATPVPEAATVPDVMERLTPEVDAPVLPDADPNMAAQAPDALAAMPVDVSAPPVDLPAGGPLAAGPSLALVEAPSFLVPEVGIPPDALPRAVPPAELGEASRTEFDFKPPEEVMPEVDEKVVEREKAAVRELVDSVSAGDMAKMVDVALSRAAGGDGYTYFRAVVTPKPGTKAVPKDVVILIDASGSIGDDRLASCRKAARGILRTCTNTGDRFNLVAFRDRFSYAFGSWRECDAAGFEAGDKWLSRLAAHGRTDVFSTISSVLTLPRDPARPLIALVVTDGDANSGVRENAEILSRFSKLNDGLVSVYMYGVKSTANRELIDVLTRGNRGESFVYGGWRWKAGSGIEALSERFRDPVVTDLRVVFASSCRAEAYPTLLKNVYRGGEVAVVGRVKGSPKEVAFSLKGLAGADAYEAFFKLPVASAAVDPALPAAWRQERDIDRMIRPD